jgi:methyl-accepting chemotaxis protein
MANFITKSLMGKLVAIFAGVALVPIGIVGYLSFTSAREALRAAEFEKLNSERELRESQIKDYLRHSVEGLSYLARVPSVAEAVNVLASYRRRTAGSASGTGFDVQSAEYSGIAAEISPSFTGFLELYGPRNAFEDLLLIDGKKGDVLYSEKRGKELGTNLKQGPYKDGGLAKTFEKALATEKQVLVDFTFHEPSGTLALFVAAPLFGASGDITGVVVLRVGPEGIGAIMKADHTTSRRGARYMVGEDGLLRCHSREEEIAGLLKKRVDSAAAQLALQGQQGTAPITDESGRMLLASYSKIHLKQAGVGADFDWAVVTEVEAGQAFAPVAALGYRVVQIAAVLALVVALVGVGVSRTIARPVVDLAKQVNRVSEGDLTVRVAQTNRGDEIGSLAEAVRSMVDTLRGQVSQMREASGVMASASAEISATASHVAQNVGRTSAAVTESVTTAEEVRQSAKVSGSQAKGVSRSSAQAVKISDSGNTATEETLRKMNVIKGQMESIGATVVKLSDHARAIEQVIETVQDLAEQSNLLAVNASIEAARAGEHGKGFVVVAQEIKSLADQSREATERVRTILDENRRWVTAVVAATEQGRKAVDAGVEQAAAAGEAIKTLARNVSEGAKAAALVDASSEQQAAGAEQVALALAEIDKAAADNRAGADQLESAARQLLELAQRVEQLLSGYHVEETVV